MEHRDVIIIGAGLAGIGFAWHMQNGAPDLSYVLLEARDRMGGTWNFFRYPGLRSDVDMHLYGYSFKPWTGGIGVASADNILSYLQEAAAETGIDHHIRYQQRVTDAAFDSQTGLWTVTIHTPDGTQKMTCKWLQFCGGYYSYTTPHRPTFRSESDFTGDILHMQDWPEGHSVAGKRVILIGSGATAVTVLPELVREAAHVTLLQRSPTYIYAGPREPLSTRLLRKLLPTKLGYHAVRRKDLMMDRVRHRLIENNPAKLKAMIRDAAMQHLPDDFDYDTHFTPRYDLGQQRICFAPDGDFFAALARPHAAIVTAHIDRFTPDGIRLKNGEELEADTILLATGLTMEFGNNVALSIDGQPVTPSETWLYKGVMFSGIPNLSIAVGSLIHSYTLRVEAQARWVARVLAHMRAKGADTVTPVLPVPVEDMPARPFTEDFNSGYIQRAASAFPKQGAGEPWVNQQSYDDSLRLYAQPLEDGALTFSRSADGQTAAA